MTQQAVEHAGRGDEMNYQVMLKGKELKRDMESSLLAVNIAKATGSDSAVRRLAGTLSWTKTNTSASTGATTGADPATADGAGTRTDGTQRAFTEAMLKSTLQSVWTSGGEPDVIMTGAFNKQVFSTFTGRSSPVEQASTKKITASVDAYESDFGTLKVVPNRFQRSRDVWIFQMDMWGIAYLSGRRMASMPLAQVGDSVRRMILSEYTLEARNEKSGGGVFDLTTS